MYLVISFKPLVFQPTVHSFNDDGSVKRQGRKDTELSRLRRKVEARYWIYIYISVGHHAAAPRQVFYLLS